MVDPTTATYFASHQVGHNDEIHRQRHNYFMILDYTSMDWAIPADHLINQKSALTMIGHLLLMKRSSYLLGCAIAFIPILLWALKFTKSKDNPMVISAGAIQNGIGNHSHIALGTSNIGLVREAVNHLAFSAPATMVSMTFSIRCLVPLHHHHQQQQT